MKQILDKIEGLEKRVKDLEDEVKTIKKTSEQKDDKNKEDSSETKPEDGSNGVIDKAKDTLAGLFDLDKMKENEEKNKEKDKTKETSEKKEEDEDNKKDNNLVLEKEVGNKTTDGKDTSINGVEVKSDKIKVVVPKLKVKDIHNPTKEEKELIKKAIEEANKDNFPEGTKVEVMDNGDVKVSFKDGRSTTITADELEKAVVKDTNTNNKENTQTIKATKDNKKGQGGKLPKTGEALIGYGLSIVSVIAGAFGIKKKFRK